MDKYESIHDLKAKYAYFLHHFISASSCTAGIFAQSWAQQIEMDFEWPSSLHHFHFLCLPSGNCVLKSFEHMFQCAILNTCFDLVLYLMYIIQSCKKTQLMLDLNNLVIWDRYETAERQPLSSKECNSQMRLGKSWHWCTDFDIHLTGNNLILLHIKLFAFCRVNSNFHPCQSDSWFQSPLIFWNVNIFFLFLLLSLLGEMKTL